MNPRSPSSPMSVEFARRGGQAGMLAALLALFLDLLWRANIAPAGVPSLPESVVAAVARLTPTSLFGWATENFGSLAQNTLWVIVLIGTVLLGYGAGYLASRSAGADFAQRLKVSAGIAVVLFLIIVAIILPIAREGFLGSANPNQGLLLAQAVLFVAIWAVAWAVLAPDAAAPVVTADGQPATGEVVSRRSAMRSLSAAALAVGVAYLGWRLARNPDTGDVEASEKAAEEIAAKARQGETKGTPGATSSPETVSPSVVEGSPTTGSELANANPEAQFAQLESEGKLTPLITSVANFYHVSKNIADPEVNGEGWSLSVEGSVAKPLKLTYQDVIARSKSSNITTLSCISNELNGDLAGTAEWSGFPLRDLLQEAGVDPAAVKIVFHAADGYDDSIPVATAMDPTTLVVTGMNGEPLPSDHGYPARIIVPPIYGMKNVKWLQRIEVVNLDYEGYWQTRGWSDPAPYQVWGRIDTPAPGEEIAAGPAVAAGVAAHGNLGISRVEISLDDGSTWKDAILEPSINPNFTWVRWIFPFDAQSGRVTMLMRATDTKGTVAPEDRRPPLPDGATGWPDRTFRIA
jgi:DMSO/TMAO reductase YedYZ molybdopterin-dependent catalytic subunit